MGGGEGGGGRRAERGENLLSRILSTKEKTKFPMSVTREPKEHLENNFTLTHFL